MSKLNTEQRLKMGERLDITITLIKNLIISDKNILLKDIAIKLNCSKSLIKTRIRRSEYENFTKLKKSVT